MTLALTWLAQPSGGQLADACALLAAAADADGVDPLSEAAALRLRHRSPGLGVHLPHCPFGI